MSTWTINGNTPEHYGVTIAQIEFAPSAASSVMIDAATDFDATESFPHNSTVTILRDGLPFFRGRSRQIEKSGDDSSESVRYVVEDVWAELERITYQEAWQIRQPDYVGPAFLPTVILGISANGVRINVGQQITEALTFAAARGAALTVGSVPAGMMLWPSKVVGMSCAAVIRECLKYYPDWIPWIDHSTSPPTFHVTPRASAQTAAIPVTDCRSVDVRKMDDRIPTGVRICYITAGLIGDNVYRTLSVDQFPSVPAAARVAPAEPGVIVTSVELAGMQVQIQKQQVQTRDLPTSEIGAIDYLKIKFPIIKDIPAGKINIAAWTTAVIPSSEDESPPIDEKLVRMPGGSRTDLPRELVKGSITEWMRKKVGRVLVEMKVEAVEATDEQKAKIETLPKSFTVVATDAVTKTYRGVSSFTAAEDVPVGIAQAFYENLLAAARFEGQISIEDEEVYPGRLHGKKINLTGSALGEWATMSAPIHRVMYDLKNGRTTVSFGPNPELSFNDFLDYLRLLNKRPHNVYTQAERAGDRLGDESAISAEGDTIGPYDSPETITSGGGGGVVAEHPFQITTSTVDGGAKYRIVRGSLQDGTNGTAIALTGITDTDRTATAGYVVLEADVDASLVVSGWALAIKTAAADTHEVGMTTSGEIRQNKIRMLIGKLTVDGAVATPWQAWFTSARVTNGVLNGVPVKLVDTAPTLASEI
jgi:hypothetical protein